jgi:transcriptional regulator with XRE-family HTH domain
MESLEDKEYRRVFAEEHVGTGLAFQIRRMREAKGWTQENIAQRTGKAQETISQWENPSYGRYSLSTLKQLAAAFDVALLVRLVSFSELADWTVDINPQRLTPPSYEEERQMPIWGVVGTGGEPAVKNIEDMLIAGEAGLGGVEPHFASVADALPARTQTSYSSTPQREGHKNAIAA